MKIKLFQFIFLILFFTKSISTGVDVQVNQDPGPLLQNETSITVNPANPGNIVIGYNEDPGGPWGNGNGLGISYSFDFGVTWQDTQIVEIWGIEADPTLDAGLNGMVYAGFITYKGFFTDTNGIFVSRSTDGGITWPLIAMVDLHLNSPSNPGPFSDKCYLCVDNLPTSPFIGNVYISWQRDNTNGVNSDVYFSASYNNGNSFSGPLRISDLPVNLSQCVGQVPKAGPNGDIYVLWGDFALPGHTTGYLFIDVSTDAGVTWGTDILIDSFLVVPRFPNPAFPGFYVRSYPTIGVDPVNHGHVYAAVAVDPDGISGPDDGDIWFWSSNNGGITWTGPVIVNDDGSINDQFQPWMDVKDNGVIDIVWLDRRNDPADQNFEVFFAYSTDGGTTFSQNIPVSDMIFPLLPGQDWLGEYIGIDVDPFDAYIAWTDTRNGDRDIFFDTIHNPELGIDEGNTNILNLNTIHCLPNPFYNELQIEYSVPYPQYVSVEVFDVSGKLINNLHNGFSDAGNQLIVWNGSDNSDNLIPHGIYFVNIKIGDELYSDKIIKLE